GYFVFLTRDENGVSQLTVAQNQCSLPPPSAIAGPFFTHSDANDFRTKWTAVGKEVKRSDFDKGYEKVGRLLASQNPSVEWRETWKFLGDDAPPIDVTSEAGLIMLESVLGKRQKDEMILRSQPRIQPARTADFGKTSVRRTLNFDILDDELTPPSTSSSPSSADVSEEENEEFFDTFTEIQDESLLDDTLGSLTGRFAAMSVISPKREEVVESLSLALNSDEDENEDDVDSFFTPPSSPPPMFVIDEAPCKVRNPNIQESIFDG
uniref:ANKLE2 third alpha/beta domain-containing protein n=2 Tax=Caenorhabditis japonica TaxID=281687 RepID=A0A8R1IQR9_CAEJA